MRNAKRKWAFLQALGKKGGIDYLEALCVAIETEATIPTETLKPIASALRLLFSSEPEANRLAAFATALCIKKKRGRPRQDSRAFWRAVNYWILRDNEGLSDGDAIAFIRDKGFFVVDDDQHPYEYREESAIRRAVREHPAAREFARGICQDEGGGEKSGD